MRIQTGKLCLGVCVLGLASLAYAQTVSTVGAITPAGAATAPVSGAGFEQYNSFNGALGLSIPLHHIGGRGEAGFDLVWNLQPNWVAAYNGNPGNAFLFAQQYPGDSGYIRGYWLRCSVYLLKTNGYYDSRTASRLG